MSVSIGDPAFSGFSNPTGGDSHDLAQQEKFAHEEVKTARQEVAESVLEEREALKVAAEANQRASEAAAIVQEKEAGLLELDPGELAPGELEALHEELEASRQEASELQQAADEANALVDQWRQYRDAMEQRLDEAKSSANALLKSLGREELYPLSPRIKDTYARRGTGLFEEITKLLLGTPKSLAFHRTAPLDARRIGVATEANSANGAQLLAQLLEENEDPAYRQTLAAEARPEATRMGSDLSELLEGLPEDEQELGRHMAHALLASLSRGVQLLGPAVAWPLVEAFAEGMRDGDPQGQLEEWLKDVLTAGPVDITFAVELAVALYGSGKTAAADEVVTAIHRAVAMARERFVQRAPEADFFDAGLVQHLPGFAQGVRPEELAQELEVFKREHLEAYEAREEGATALGAVLNGAALAVAFSHAGGLPANAHTGTLLEQSVFALGLADRFSKTDVGQRVLGFALELQSREERTFLDALPDVTRVLGAIQSQNPGALAQAGLEAERFGDGGASFLGGIQHALSQLLVPHLVMLRSANHPLEALELLRNTVVRNPGLFGLDEEAAAAACQVFTSLEGAVKPLDLRRALIALEGLGVPTLKALGVVLALSSVASVSSRSKELVEVLRSSLERLGLGSEGLGVLCCLFGQFQPIPTVARYLNTPREGTLGLSGSTLFRTMETFSALLGGLPAALCSMLAIASRPLLVEGLVTSFLQPGA